MKPAAAKSAARILAAIGKPKQVLIVMALAEKTYNSVRELAEDCGLDSMTICNAISVLRDMGVVDFEQVGNHRVYSLSKTMFDGKKLTIGPVTLGLK